MLAFDEAVARLLDTVGAVGSERVGIFDCDGRVLAEDVVAKGPLPAFDHSAMDGYALRTSDLEGEGPWSLPVIATSAAGDPPRPAPSERGAVRIYTGAPLPIGMDAVVMQEDVDASEEGGARRAALRARPRAGAWIRRRGDDLAEGAIALARGRRLSPGDVALAAALDRATLAVGRRPVVTVVGTGDELRSPGDAPAEGSVVESNGFFVASAARRVGATARLAPFLRDDPDAMRASIETALRGTDLLVTIGGVSVGARDFVKGALEAAGVSIDFYKVAMKPGKPLTVGRHPSGALVLGLPGNPASASLTFLLFGVPVLRAMQGETRREGRARRLAVEGSLRRTPGRTEFARAKLVEKEGRTVARLCANQASGAVTSFSEADALVRVEADRGDVADGEELDVIALADLLSG